MLAVGIAQRHDLERERLGGNRGDRERALVERVVLGASALAVEREALKRETFAVEHERPAAGRYFGVRPQPELGGDARRLRIERDIELDLLDEIIGGA